MQHFFNGLDINCDIHINVSAIYKILYEEWYAFFWRENVKKLCHNLRGKVFLNRIRFKGLYEGSCNWCLQAIFTPG